MKWLLLVHAAATLFMVGVIWVIQVVHYPLFKFVGTEVFPHYQAAHVTAITRVVGPAMLVELVTAVGLLFQRPQNSPPALVWAGLLQVPQHNVLASGFNAQAHHTLVLSNWLRTVAWSVRGVLALLLVASALPSSD